MALPSARRVQGRRRLFFLAIPLLPVSSAPRGPSKTSTVSYTCGPNEARCFRHGIRAFPFSGGNLAHSPPYDSVLWVLWPGSDSSDNGRQTGILSRSDLALLLVGQHSPSVPSVGPGVTR